MGTSPGHRLCRNATTPRDPTRCQTWPFGSLEFSRTFPRAVPLCRSSARSPAWRPCSRVPAPAGYLTLCRDPPIYTAGRGLGRTSNRSETTWWYADQLPLRPMGVPHDDVQIRRSRARAPRGAAGRASRAVDEVVLPMDPGGPLQALAHTFSSGSSRGRPERSSVHAGVLQPHKTESQMVL